MCAKFKYERLVQLNRISLSTSQLNITICILFHSYWNKNFLLFNPIKP